MTYPLAYTIRQCVRCRHIYSWLIISMVDLMKFEYLHCGKPTEFIEIQGPLDRQSVCCDGDSEAEHVSTLS